MKEVQIALRVTPETKAMLIARAEADHRTLSSLLEKIIAEWLKRNPRRLRDDATAGSKV